MNWNIAANQGNRGRASGKGKTNNYFSQAIGQPKFNAAITSVIFSGHPPHIKEYGKPISLNNNYNKFLLTTEQYRVRI